MRIDQFEALARLAGMRPGSGAYTGAMMHLVHNAKQTEAAEKMGVAPSTISQAVARIHRAELDAIRATR
jgi:DNA-binding MarR family transcriptional regulator